MGYLWTQTRKQNPVPAFELNVEFHISHIVWIKIFQDEED